MRSLALIAAFGLLASGEPEPLELMGRFDPDQIPEASGIAASLRHPGIYWVHNDSGNPPLLFAIQRDGRIQHTVRLQIPNLDWEDIALDDSGRIALGDVGNNQGLMPIRVIHRFPEPDLAGDPERLLRPSESVHYRYPADDRFDAEALVVEGELAVVIAKRRGRSRGGALRHSLPPPCPPSPASRSGASGSGSRIRRTGHRRSSEFQRPAGGGLLHHRDPGLQSPRTGRLEPTPAIRGSLPSHPGRGHHLGSRGFAARERGARDRPDPGVEMEAGEAAGLG